MTNKRIKTKQTEMSSNLKAVQVSPLIKGLRWSLLLCGIAAGKMKLKAYAAYEVTAGPKRQKKIKEKYEILHRESFLRDSNELVTVAKEFEVTKLPPGWNDQL